MDDILIFSENLADYDKHVKEVLRRLSDHKLYVNLEKCDFDTIEVRFLGFVITPDGISMEKERVEAIISWAIPQSVKDLQVFLGFANFYCRFIKGYSKVIEPMTWLLRKDAVFIWGKDTNDAFEALKTLFTEAPLLVHFKGLQPLCIEPDALAFAIGLVLLQQEEDGSWHLIAFLSRKLILVEGNYVTADAELLAIFESF